MILRRATATLGDGRPVDSVAGPDVWAWLLELRSTLSPISVGGYVRTLKVLGNWLRGPAPMRVDSRLPFP